MSEPNTRGVGTYLAYLLAAVGAITLIGTVGFYHFEAGHNERVTGFSDSLWWALVTITTIGYGDIYPVTAGGRICAVFLMFSGIGALSVSTAGIAAYLVRFTSIDQLRTWGLKDHVVICGLGRMGLLMSNAFRQEHHRVLVIERDEDNPRIHACRESGAIVILGNASSPETLRRARLDHAKHLIVVCGDDGSNAEVAAAAHATVTRRGTKLGCSVHLVDPDLWHLLRKWDLAASPSLRVEFFNIFDLGARAMLGQVPPFDPPAAVGEESQAGRLASDTAVPHLLVVGSSRLAQHLVIQSVHQWRERAGTMPHRIRVTMVGEDNDAVHAALRLRCPGFDQVADFAWHSIRLQSPDFHQARFLIDDHGRISVTRVYVCLDADAPSVSAALVLLARLHTTPVPVVVRMDQDSGLARLMQAARGRPEYAHLHVFGMLERVCQPDLVMRGANEMLARALHDEYLANLQGVAAAGANAAAVPWDALPIDIKEQNRTEADHISATLASIGCSVSPIMDLATPPVAFTPEEIELMARLEHERWLAERRALGWTLGPRDAARKTNRNMLPWDELAEDARTLTRNTVRRLPAFLARVGLVVYREAA